MQDFFFHTIGDFDDDDDDDDDDDVIELSQWLTTDPSNLTHYTEIINEHVNIVTEQLHILAVHSCISKC